MPIRVDSAAKRLCELSDWSLSNLQLQKLLYLAQVQHADSHDGAALVDASFQAWDYGPVIPSLYRKLRIYGADSVNDVFYDARAIRPGSDSDKTLREVWRQFGTVAPGELIEVTHWELGAWARRYEPGIKGIPISQLDIIQEAENRHRFERRWREVVA